MATFEKDSYVIGLPFSFTGAGSVGRVSESSGKYWRDKVVTYMSTNDFERIWYMYFGAGLQKFVFAPAELASVDVYGAISEMFTRWLPELTLISSLTNYDQDTGTLTFNISYALPNGEENSVKITTAELTAAGELVKVISNG